MRNEQDEQDPSTFTQFKETFKNPEEGVMYENLQEYTVSFDSKNIHLIDPHNLELIISDMNNIPTALFKYRMIMDLQSKLVQQLEDEYARWYAERWIEVDNEKEPKYDKSGNYLSDKKIERTEGAKEKTIITRFKQDYEIFQHNLREEKYRLALIKSCVASIDNYSYKLHAILNYKQLLEGKGINT